MVLAGWDLGVAEDKEDKLVLEDDVVEHKLIPEVGRPSVAGCETMRGGLDKLELKLDALSDLQRCKCLTDGEFLDCDVGVGAANRALALGDGDAHGCGYGWLLNSRGRDWEAKGCEGDRYNFLMEHLNSSEFQFFFIKK